MPKEPTKESRLELYQRHQENLLAIKAVDIDPFILNFVELEKSKEEIS